MDAGSADNAGAIFYPTIGDKSFDGQKPNATELDAQKRLRLSGTTLLVSESGVSQKALCELNDICLSTLPLSKR